MSYRTTLAATVLIAGAAGGQTQDNPLARHFDLVPTKLTAARDSGLALEGARAPVEGSARFSFLLDYNAGILALVVGEDKVGDVVPYRFDAHFMAAYQPVHWLELALDVPAALLQGDNFSLRQSYGIVQPWVSGGLGNIRLLPRAILLDPDRFPVGLAFIPELRLPTGNKDNFLGDSGVVFAPRLAVERAFGPVRILANLGTRLRRQAQFINLIVENELTAGAGAIYRLPDLPGVRNLNAVAELNLGTPLSAPFTIEQANFKKTVGDVLLGLQGKLGDHWGAALGIGRGLAAHSGYGREAIRIVASLNFELEHVRLPARGEPLMDSDGDGIPDAQDACPDRPGPAEFDGCPDTDGDQVPDNVDRCPNTPGPAENAGCPYDKPPFVVLEGDRIRLRGSILFDLGEARIQKQSLPLLDEVHELLSKHDKLGPVLVEGHTDNRGGRSFNQDLSERRAKAVVDYLMHKSIDRNRLRSQGYGYDHPVATNDNALGRAQNRRVEFQLLKEPPPAHH